MVGEGLTVYSEGMDHLGSWNECSDKAGIPTVLDPLVMKAGCFPGSPAGANAWNPS